MKRRTALGLGLMGALSPATLTAVLRESAAEAMDFTHQRTMSSVGAGVLDHLDAVVLELDRASRRRSASELFPVARAYRNRVEELINGRHTLAEARELYVRAANLSELLSTLAHDLGSQLAAEAYAIDSYRHADLAGHDEASAWAAGTLASLAVHAGQPGKAVRVAHRGLSRAPRHTPIAAQLHAKAARGYALRGDRAACAEHLAKSKAVCERMSDESPGRSNSGEACARTPYLVAKYAAEAHNRLLDHRAAETEARAGLAVETLSPGDADINRIELGIALVGQGAPDEAAEHGKKALSKPRFLGGILTRAHQLDAMLAKRYPRTSAADEFHERYQQLVGQGHGDGN